MGRVTYGSTRGFAICAAGFFVCAFLAERFLPQYWIPATIILAVTFSVASMFDARTPWPQSFAITFASAGAMLALVGAWYALHGRNDLIAVTTGASIALLGAAAYRYLRMRAANS